MVFGAQERGINIWNRCGGSDQAIRVLNTATKGYIVNLDQVSAGGGSFESNGCVAVVSGAIIVTGKFVTIGREQNKGGIQAGVDDLSLAVEVDSLPLGKSDFVMVDCGVIGVAINDGVEGESFSSLRRVIGAVIFFRKVTDDEGTWSCKAKAGLSTDFVNTGRSFGCGRDSVAQRIGSGRGVFGSGMLDGFGGESGV